METNLHAIKEESKMLFDVMTFQEASDYIGMDGFIISHPYANSAFNMDSKGKLVNLLEDEKAAQDFRNHIFKKIDKTDDLMKFILLLNKPYYLYWLKRIRPYLNETDFALLFKEIWVLSENPQLPFPRSRRLRSPSS